jgi:hypothetical protein
MASSTIDCYHNAWTTLDIDEAKLIMVTDIAVAQLAITTATKAHDLTIAFGITHTKHTNMLMC